uniref:Uncharacterized protein n=1 Tax=Oryza brachyantha TaxID=4533 RepID=J3LD83_ORYBR
MALFCLAPLLSPSPCPLSLLFSCSWILAAPSRIPLSFLATNCFPEIFDISGVFFFSVSFRFHLHSLGREELMMMLTKIEAFFPTLD